MQFSDSDFDRLSWHDCHIWGISFRSGEPSEGDWTSELLLDIDFICEWCCTNPNGRFRVAPATLAFHDVGSLEIAVHWTDSSLAYPLSIAEISRAAEGSTSRWRVALNWPEGGEITFLAVGFNQTLRAEPVLIEEQRFTLRERENLLGR
ncbi:MAG TPA: hypothetical protein VHC22_28185 [Pirellulales bacterium]|nr:hypothetical protein [Pirellulales bacterium]